MGIINITLIGEGYVLKVDRKLVSKPDGSGFEYHGLEVSAVKCTTSSNTKQTPRGQDGFDDCPIGE